MRPASVEKSEGTQLKFEGGGGEVRNSVAFEKTKEEEEERKNEPNYDSQLHDLDEPPREHGVDGHLRGRPAPRAMQGAALSAIRCGVAGADAALRVGLGA